MENKFADVRALGSLDYFYETRDGVLHLREGIADNIVDFHTHVGWGIVSKKISGLGDTIFPYVGASIDLDHYSAYDYSKSLKKRATRKTLAAILSKGKNKRTSASHLLFEMQALNVSASALMAVDIIGSNNSNIVLSAAKQEPDMFIPFISLHPKNKKNPAILEKYVKKGAQGIKIHPPIQRVRPNSKYIGAIAEMAEKFGLPILFHCGHSPLTPKAMKKFSKMSDYEKIIFQYPNVTFILGHSGIDEWEDAVKIANKHGNTFLELSGQPADVIKKIIKSLGSERLLFGSDWPYYPIALPLAKVLLATEGDAKARNSILSGNAYKIINSLNK